MLISITGISNTFEFSFQCVFQSTCLLLELLQSHLLPECLSTEELSTEESLVYCQYLLRVSDQMRWVFDSPQPLVIILH